MSYKWSNGNLEKSYGFNLEKISSSNNRFHAIYFIDNVTGSLLLSNKYTDNSKFTSYEDLISGFLNALNLFMNEINDNDTLEEEIQEINFRDSRILYERKGRLMVIGISKKTNLLTERKILQNILIDFYSRFKNKIEHFNGVIDIEMLNYREFLNDLDLDTLSRIDIHRKL